MVVRGSVHALIYQYKMGPSHIHICCRGRKHYQGQYICVKYLCQLWLELSIDKHMHVISSSIYPRVSLSFNESNKRLGVNEKYSRDHSCELNSSLLSRFGSIKDHVASMIINFHQNNRTREFKLDSIFIDVWLHLADLIPDIRQHSAYLK